MSTVPIPKPGALLGKSAPSFNLDSSTGQKVNTDSFKGKTVVLYFYPKADTPGCTKETCGFRDALAGYQKIGVPVYGISPDPVKDVKSFAEKFNINFPLLADADQSVSKAYDVWGEKTFAGTTYLGALRTTFIIKDGKIAKVFESVKPEGHDKEVMEWLTANP